MKLLDPQQYLKISKYIVSSPSAIIATVFSNHKTWWPNENNMQKDAQW